LKFETDTEIGQNGTFCKDLKDLMVWKLLLQEAGSLDSKEVCCFLYSLAMAVQFQACISKKPHPSYGWRNGALFFL